jgi:hypothetical protein
LEKDKNAVATRTAAKGVWETTGLSDKKGKYVPWLHTSLLTMRSSLVVLSSMARARQQAQYIWEAHLTAGVATSREDGVEIQKEAHAWATSAEQGIGG